LDQIGVRAYGAVPGNQKCHIGVYNSDGYGFPCSLLCDSGEINIPAGGGFLSAGISLTLDAGLYHLAILTKGPDIIRINSTHVAIHFTPREAVAEILTPIAGWYSLAETYGDMPTTFPSFVGETIHYLAIALRIAGFE